MEVIGLRAPRTSVENFAKTKGFTDFLEQILERSKNRPIVGVLRIFVIRQCISGCGRGQ